MPEEFLTAEVLPVRVLDPALGHHFIRQPEGVLQIVQPCHQADRHTRAAVLGILKRQTDRPGLASGFDLPTDTARAAGR